MSSRRQRFLWRAYSRVYDTLWDNALTERVARELAHDCARFEMPIEEIGAGTGLVTMHLVALGGEVRASEPQAGMRLRLRHRVPHVVVNAGFVEDLTPIDGEARLVVAANVVHLTADPSVAIARLRRRAGGGGRVMIVTPDPSATVQGVARELRAVGESLGSILRFVAIHLLLAPFTALAGGGPPPAVLRAVVDQPALELRRLNRVSWLLVLDGAIKGPAAADNRVATAGSW